MSEISSRSRFYSNMAVPQVIAAFCALIEAIGLPGNLLVIVTIVLERRFHVMRYILLASLAVSDFLFLILVSSFRIASTAQEKWLYGETMCHLNAFFSRYFYLNTVLHLVAVSYERYSAIVKSPLTYDGTITKSKMAFIALIWVIPIPLSIGPFLGLGKFVYNPEIFFCEQGWSRQSGTSGWIAMIFVIAFFVVPFLVIVFVNWSVYKTAGSQINALEVQIGTLGGLESQQQEMSRQISERRAAVDVSIIIAAFLVSFLPTWITGLCRQFVQRANVPEEAVLITNCIFFLSSLCNPIIYSIRKRDFQTAVKKVLRRIGDCGISNDIDNNVIAMNSARFGANPGTEAFFLTPAAALAIQHQDGRLPSISQMQQIEEGSPNDIDSYEIVMNNLTFSANLGTQTSTVKLSAALATQHQEGRLYRSTRRAELNHQICLSPISEFVE